MMAILDLYLKNNPLKPVTGSKKEKKGNASAQTKQEIVANLNDSRATNDDQSDLNGSIENVKEVKA
jgi:hypothetical protein